MIMCGRKHVLSLSVSDPKMFMLTEVLCLLVNVLHAEPMFFFAFL
jgi:hypothetical protein